MERFCFLAFFADFESTFWKDAKSAGAEFRRSDFLLFVFRSMSELVLSFAINAFISKAETVPSAHNKVGKILMLVFFRADSPCS